MGRATQALSEAVGLELVQLQLEAQLILAQLELARLQQAAAEAGPRTLVGRSDARQLAVGLERVRAEVTAPGIIDGFLLKLGGWGTHFPQGISIVRPLLALPVASS